jgi:hypothetical protein
MAYVEGLRAPQGLKTLRNGLGLFLLVESYKVTHQRCLSQACRGAMQSNYHEIYQKYFHIFNENCK